MMTYDLISDHTIPDDSISYHPGFFVLRIPRAHMGGGQGGLARLGPRPNPTPTTFQLRLKIALVFNAVFLKFRLHLGSQDGTKNQ